MPTPPPRSQGDPVRSVVDRATSWRMGLAPEGQPPTPLCLHSVPAFPLPVSWRAAHRMGPGVVSQHPVHSKWARPLKCRALTDTVSTQTTVPAGPAALSRCSTTDRSSGLPGFLGPQVTGEEAFFFFFLWMARCLGLYKASVLSFLALIHLSI